MPALSPTELVTQINNFSETFLNRLPDYSDSPEKEIVTVDTRKQHVEKYTDEIRKLLVDNPETSLDEDDLYNNENGVITYFITKELEYKEKKEKPNKAGAKKEILGRDTMRQAKYIVRLRKGLYTLLSGGGTKGAEIHPQEALVIRMQHPTPPPPKQRPQKVRPKKQLAVEAVIVVNEIPVVEPVVEEITPEEAPLPLAESIPQIDEAEQVVVSSLLQQITSLPLTHIKSWSQLTTFEAIENMKKEYTAAHTTLQHLLHKLAPYMDTSQKSEHQQRLDLCTEPLQKALNIFKAEQQKGNGIYNKLSLVKTELHELCTTLLNTCAEEKIS